MQKILRGNDLIKAYIDTSVISRLSDPLKGNPIAISEDEAAAILTICGSEIELVTSLKMLEEVLRSTDVRQRALLALVATLSTKVPSQNLMHSTSGAWGTTAFGAAPFGGGGVTVDPLLVQLRRIFDSGDAEHVFQAVKNDCTYFLTLDKSTIIERAKHNRTELDRLCPNMKFVSPTELEQLIIEST